jgi:GTP cyclohydrolase III
MGAKKKPSDARKAAKAAGRAAGEARRKQRKQKQADAEKKNRVLKASGEHTTWEQAEAERAARRAAEGKTR